MKNNKNIKGVIIFQSIFRYTGYTDDSAFFLKDKNSIQELLNTVNCLLSFTILKPNLSIYEVSGVGLLKEVNVAICGIKCTELTKRAFKILGVFFSYEKNLKNSFRKTILSIESILKMQRRMNLTLEGKKNTFKTSALRKVTFFTQVIAIPNQIREALQQI